METPFAGKSTGGDPARACRSFSATALDEALTRYTVGSVLSGKYRLDSLLGEGGMGSVWRAANLMLDLPVAIKLIRADLDHHALRARLQLEARAVAKLGHPAIVRIYDVGETEHGDPFIVMELLHGETLAQLLSRGRLSAVRAVQLLLPIIDACAVAHACGIVHRDLKPDNILIAVEGQCTQPKILDFGIAKLTDPRDEDHRLTEIGTVVGSPDYMSPEQARGRDDVDHRTDVWSLCVLLYESITGTTPFSASNYNALLRAIVEDEPPPLVERAAGDARLWEILRKGLAKERQARHRSMSELGRVLASWLVSHGVQEDACGTSVESKWLGKASELLLSTEATTEQAARGNLAFDPKATHDSRAGVADSRGPFTATIRPNVGSRSRTLRAAVAAGAALTALTAVLLLVPSGSSRVASAASTHHPQSAAAPAQVQAAEPEGHPAEPAVNARNHPAEPAVMVTPSATAPSATPSPPRPTRTLPAASANRGVFPAVKPSPPRATAPAGPSPRPRELDLISPY